MAVYERELASIVSSEPSSKLVQLAALSKAKMLWVDKHATRCAPHSPTVGSRGETEEAGLLAAASYSVSSSDTGPVTGWADRYGGGGIGVNGGSGRAVVLNGLSIKGVGPTPLIGKGASPNHSGGGAYLEEALREALFSQLFRKILPHGAVPVSAIIDTGEDQTWHFGDGASETQRRVLIVRPFPLRPAHFQRAHQYRPSLLNETRLDVRRVRHNFVTASDRFGREGLRSRLVTCYSRWSEQLAFAHVKGLALGATASNIDIDGRILDFGASSILPGVANFVVSPSVTSLCDMAKLMQSLNSLSLMAVAFDAELYGAFQNEVFDAVEEAYRVGIVRHALSSIGLGHRFESIEPNGKLLLQIYADYMHYHRAATRLRVDLLPSNFRVECGLGPGLKSIWSKDRPSSLEPLARTLTKNFPDRCSRDEESELKQGPINREALRSELHGIVAATGHEQRYEHELSVLLGKLEAQL